MKSRRGPDREADYHKCRQSYLVVGVFYMDEVQLERLKRHDVKISAFPRHFCEQARSDFTPGLAELYGSFAKATRQQPWDSTEEFVDTMQAEDRTEDDIREMGGYSVIYDHRPGHLPN